MDDFFCFGLDVYKRFLIEGFIAAAFISKDDIIAFNRLDVVFKTV